MLIPLELLKGSVYIVPYTRFYIMSSLREAVYTQIQIYAFGRLTLNLTNDSALSMRKVLY